MGIFRFLFGKKKQVEHAEKQAQNVDVRQESGLLRQPLSHASGMQVTYNDKLIERLISEHRQLAQIIGTAAQAFENGDYYTTVLRLREFRQEISKHLLLEKVKLYAYQKQLFAGNEHAYGFIRGLQREMEIIGKTLHSFLDKYDNLHTDSLLVASFKEDFATVKDALVRRIQCEETMLYPLYQPSQNMRPL